jgi:hypothetical protein
MSDYNLKNIVQHCKMSFCSVISSKVLMMAFVLYLTQNLTVPNDTILLIQVTEQT